MEGSNVLGVPFYKDFCTSNKISDIGLQCWRRPYGAAGNECAEEKGQAKPYFGLND
jgi:hypothetical protein